MYAVSVGTLVVDQFPAFEPDGYTKRSGLLPDDFEIQSFFNGSATSIPVDIIEIDDLGEYRVTYTPTAVGVWVVQVLVDFSKDIWQSKAMAELPSTLSDRLDRVLGLLHYNSILDRQVYDSNGQLTSARLRVFDSPDNVPAVPGGDETTGLIQKYEIQATYSGSNVVTKYSLKRLL